MKKIFNIALSILLVLPFSGCSDFLSVYPLNAIVEENFWESRSDVESVLMAAYAKLESADCITRMSFWGEMRSDNFVLGSKSSTPEDIRRVLERDNLMESNQYVTWACFYDVINLANTVLEYAEPVQKKDPNYKVEQMHAHMAEARALRALSYFYLIRSFKDVPYVTKASKDDSEDFRIPASTFEYILENEIKSLEETVPSYGSEWANKKFSEAEEMVGRFTRAGVYALLADMTLWANDYDSCIKYCDYVIKLKKEQYKEYLEKHRTTSVIDLYNGYPLIRVAKEVGGENMGNAYSQIFGEKYSFESIFELAFIRDQSVKNDFISSYYGTSDRRQSVGYLAANDDLVNKNVSNGGLFSQTKDTRFWESFNAKTGVNKNERRIIKYVELGLDYKSGSSNFTELVPVSRPDNISPNWIIYRFTDVLLMQAEAMACKATSIDDPLVTSAILNVNAVYRRAIADNVKSTNDTLKVTDLKTVADLENYVLNERRRELLFEGKRWYDMVRVCRRRGNTDYVRNNVLSKFTENVEAIRIKFSDMNALYAPIAKSELKINPQLKQNPVYKENEDISKSN